MKESDIDYLIMLLLNDVKGKETSLIIELRNIKKMCLKTDFWFYSVPIFTELRTVTER